MTAFAATFQLLPQVATSSTAATIAATADHVPLLAHASETTGPEAAARLLLLLLGAAATASLLLLPLGAAAAAAAGAIAAWLAAAGLDI